ncbi:MAG: hypothetical protein AVDCRST_MAG85-4001 [uncultured Solirubrobacteraceae bacterium]|uniref:Uncharacterized protein n=1 Tax=uncultured Solirubrobacteraceae bacterium TaxID=1162706 RepID=A0A6J4TZQ7_9ACTN|nr:MAG: hypothetical protein AVDCRST_MAG85-4001 [uncultured Solirubrobacteraceae bacterium]
MRRPATTTARTTRTAPRVGRPSLPGRRKPQPQSNAQKIFGAVTKALPSAAAAKKVKPSGKGKNVALLGIAGGLAAAIKNRDKLRGKKTETVVVQEPVVAGPEAVYTAPATTPPVTP